MPTTRLRRRATRAARAAMAADNSEKLDAAWFARNPHRHYRARLSTPQELGKLKACAAMPPVPAGMQVWTAVWQVFPGLRHRHYLSAAVLTHNVPEEVARSMFSGEVDHAKGTR